VPLVTRDREEAVEVGDAFYLPPGHIPFGNAPDSTLVQFSPTEDLREVTAGLMKNMAALQGNLDLIRCQCEPVEECAQPRPVRPFPPRGRL
jgi:hypothetical protein